MKKIFFGFCLACCLVSFFIRTPAFASYPERPIRMIASSAAGGGTDQWGRMLCSLMEKDLQQKITVNNMVGAGGGTATIYVWNAPHDGYTFCSANDSTPAIPVMTGMTQTAKDWTFFIAGGSPGLICVNSNSGIKDLDALVKRAIDAPGKTKIASCAGSVWFSQVSVLNKYCGLPLGNVPIAGTRPAIIACVSGETEAVIASVGEMVDFIKSGHLIPIAMMQDEGYTLESTFIPAITSIYPEYKQFTALKQWQGIMIPNDTPEEIQVRIEKAFRFALSSPEMDSFVKMQHGILYNYVGRPALEYAMEVEQITSWLLHDMGLAQFDPATLGIAKPE